MTVHDGGAKARRTRDGVREARRDLGVDDQRARVDLAERLGELVEIFVVERDADGRRLRDRPEGDDGFDAVEQRRDAVARRDAAALERDGERARIRVELAVGDRSVSGAQRDCTFVALGRELQRGCDEQRKHLS